MTNSNRKLKLKINSIGPLKNVDKSFDTNSLNTVLFATNGSGKTFISRCFDLLSNIQQGKVDNNLKDLISFGCNEADFTFDFSDNDKKNELSFKITQDKILDTKFDSELILHVFNKDFVDNNVARNNYAIDSKNITGEILIGSEKIDVTKEEAELENLTKNKKSIEQLLNTEIEHVRATISKLGIRPNLQEFKDINFQNLLNYKKYNGVSFEKATQNYALIKNIPENLKEIQNFNYTLDTGIFPEIISALEKEVTLSKISEDFKHKIAQKTDFIKRGLDLLKEDKTKCPFCESSLSDKMALIDEYNEYFNQEEAKFEEVLQTLDRRLKGFKDDIKNYENDYNKIKLLYMDQKQYFLDLEQLVLPNFPDKTNLEEVISNFSNLIKEKSLNKSKIAFETDFNLQKSVIEDFANNIENVKKEINNKIEEIRNKKETISEEQKMLEK